MHVGEQAHWPRLAVNSTTETLCIIIIIIIQNKQTRKSNKKLEQHQQQNKEKQWPIKQSQIKSATEVSGV